MATKINNDSSLSVIGELPSGMPGINAPDLSWSRMQVGRNVQEAGNTKKKKGKGRRKSVKIKQRKGT